MAILISAIIFAILYVAYCIWIYILSNVFTIKRFADTENNIENVKMEKYFNFK